MIKHETFTDKKAVARVVALILVVTLAVTVLCGSKLSVAVGSAKRLIPIYRVDRADKKIAITFDCAWGVDYTDKLLSIMQENGVKCTFFAVQFWVEKYPEYVRKIDSSGHEIGTHSATHPHMSKLSPESVRSELETSRKAIEEIIGKPVNIFRAPFGEYDDRVIATATELQLYTVQWDVDSLDWKNLSANEIVERVLKRVKSGSVILCHNNGLHTAEAVERIIPILKSQGYEFVTVSELIYKSDYRIDGEGVQHALN